ncbi:MAG: hypothetical protein D6809_02965 [Gammaproteobacteria bacterium]|nr:MAG: hypothetical protein D6809_02965 [Gammaproteobacteria bacterium]
MDMGRRRRRDTHLPPRMHRKGQVYYHVARVDGRLKWTRLSDDLGEALALWGRLEGHETIPGTGPGTVSAAIARYRGEALPGLRPASRTEYGRILGRLEAVFGALRLDELRPSDVAAYLDRRSAKVAANREIAVLSAIYQHAIRWGWCEDNPCRHVRRNPERARRRYLSDDELRRLREAADTQWRCIIDLAYLTALRRGDLMRLRLPDITEDGLLVEHQKTGARVLYTMTPALQAVLARARGLRRRASSMYLFATRDGTPYTVGGWNSAWRRLVARSGVEDVHFHDLRAKALTDAAREGGRDYAQALAGHADVSMTEAYIRAREWRKVTPLDAAAARILEGPSKIRPSGEKG